MLIDLIQSFDGKPVKFHLHGQWINLPNWAHLHTAQFVRNWNNEFVIYYFFRNYANVGWNWWNVSISRLFCSISCSAEEKILKLLASHSKISWIEPDSSGMFFLFKSIKSNVDKMRSNNKRKWFRPDCNVKWKDQSSGSTGKLDKDAMATMW